jgi:predicted transcriptional regulator/DNA-binding XRE family transcriptional regulator
MVIAADRKLYLGPRLRVLRRELGLNQTQMAEELGISPSYLNHLERNQRPLTAQMLLRLTHTYDIDLREFVAGAREADSGDLQEIFADRLVRDIGIPRHEVMEVAENYPSVAEAVGRLYRALGDLRRMPDRVEQLGADPSAAAAPLDWLRGLIEHRRNHFPDIEQAAEALAATMGAGPEALLRDIPAQLQHAHGISVRVVPQTVLVGLLRHYDFHRRRLMLSEQLPMASRIFALAYGLASEALASPIEATLQACSPPDEEARALLKMALTNHAAAALTMPYSSFFAAAEESGYDLALLGSRFGASFEQVAHRLTTLDRQGQRGVPFFFLKLDAAGNVSKRFAPDNAPVPRFGGGCPRWGMQRAFWSPDELVVDRIEHIDGTRFLTMAKAVRRIGARMPAIIVLGCSEKHAGRVGYHRGVAGIDPTPVGVGCNICVRADCPERSLPPVTRALDLRSYQRPEAPYPFRLL